MPFPESPTRCWGTGAGGRGSIRAACARQGCCRGAEAGSVVGAAGSSARARSQAQLVSAASAGHLPDLPVRHPLSAEARSRL